jgi:hypothetical protein
MFDAILYILFALYLLISFGTVAGWLVMAWAPRPGDESARRRRGASPTTVLKTPRHS